MREAHLSSQCFEDQVDIVPYLLADVPENDLRGRSEVKGWQWTRVVLVIATVSSESFKIRTSVFGSSVASIASKW